MNNKDFYLQRQRSRIVSNSLECSTGKVAWQISLVFAFIFTFMSFDFSAKSISYPMLAFGVIYLVMGLFQLYVCKRTEKEIFNYGAISKSTRRLGIILIPLVLTGNFFVSITGFMLVKEDKPIEYSISVYSLLVTLFVIVVSLVNLFKPYVADTFPIGMAGLAIVAVFNVIVMIAVAKKLNGANSMAIDKSMLPIAILSIVSGFIGNAFALLLGVIMIAKIFRKDKEISIEWIDVIRRLFKNYMSVIGLFFITFLIAVSVCSNFTFDYDMATLNNYQALLQKPSLMYPFGTDNYGRCIFTRIIFGASISLSVGFVSTMVPIAIGGILGAYSGFYGGKTDNIIMRLLDVLYAVPGILLAVAIIAAFGANTFNLIMALSIGGIPTYARTVRATVLTLSGQEFIEAAKACGAKSSLIIFKHIIPNSLAPIIVRATLSIGGAVLSTSSLSYLGLGVEPHIPEWGNILKAGSTYLEINPYIAIFPGIAIILIVLAFNYFGDGLRDALDPKLK